MQILRSRVRSTFGPYLLIFCCISVMLLFSLRVIWPRISVIHALLYIFAQLLRGLQWRCSAMSHPSPRRQCLTLTLQHLAFSTHVVMYSSTVSPWTAVYDPYALITCTRNCAMFQLTFQASQSYHKKHHCSLFSVRSLTKLQRNLIIVTELPKLSNAAHYKMLTMSIATSEVLTPK